MRFLIYGKGWIAQQLISYLKKESIDYIEGVSRVDDIDKVRSEILDNKVTNVICLIGRTHGQIGDKVYTTIDYLEQPGKLVENLRDNLYSPIALGLLCKELNVHLLYLGTGCIFSYDDKHELGDENGFTENDLPNFFGSSYSTVKGFTDRLMHLLPVCNLRIRMPISSDLNSRNFITKIVNYDKICSIANSMTVLDDFIPIIISLSLRRFEGTLNLTNPGVISHNEILEMYKEIVDSKFTWENFSYEEQIKILAAGRSNNYLDTSLLESMYDVPNIKDSVRNVLLRMRDNM
jgi:3,5-epimerase/4-reductase